MIIGERESFGSGTMVVMMALFEGGEIDGDEMLSMSGVREWPTMALTNGVGSVEWTAIKVDLAFNAVERVGVEGVDVDGMEGGFGRDAIGCGAEGFPRWEAGGSEMLLDLESCSTQTSLGVCLRELEKCCN